MTKPRPDLAEMFERGQMEAVGVIQPLPPTRRAFHRGTLRSVDTSVIRHALESSRGIAPYEIDDLATAGVSIPEILEDCITCADLVVAVIGGGKAKENVLFELGFATALNNRILALVPPEDEPAGLGNTLSADRAGQSRGHRFRPGSDPEMCRGRAGRATRGARGERPSRSVNWLMGYLVKLVRSHLSSRMSRN